MIYIHVPFCKSFCVYCAFYSELCSGAKASDSQELFVRGMLQEIRCRRSEIAAHSRPLAGESARPGSRPSPAPRTLYVGGGTPSQLPPALLRRIVEALPPDAGADEFTVEVNPEDIVTGGPGYVRELLAMGVNRISMGIQSFDDEVLRWMRRRHSAAAAREAFRLLRAAGVQNISIDLICGIAGLSDETLLETLREAVSLRPEHISVYQLSPDEGSDLYDMIASGEYEPMQDEGCRRQYELVCRTLAEAGYRHYEVSNWALPGREAVHNSAYWRRSPYIGLGPGAHSFDGERRRWNGPLPPEGTFEAGISPEEASHVRLSPEGAPAAPMPGVTPAAPSPQNLPWGFEQEVLTDENARIETIMLGLRTADGVDAAWLEANCDPDALQEDLHMGSIVLRQGRYRIPESSFFVSDDIIASLI